MAKTERYGILKIAVDLLCIVFITYPLIVCPILSHYDSSVYGPDGRLVLSLKLMFVDGPFFVFGIVWLAIRYADVLNKKYPLLFDPRPKYRIRFVASGLSLYLVGYLILKNILWR